MMSSAHLFTDIFDADPLAGIELSRGNATALKKCYHKLAARLRDGRVTYETALARFEALRPHDAW